MRAILGIDPGVTGAIAVICPSVIVWDMPPTPHDLFDLLRYNVESCAGFEDVTVFVEQQHAMPKNGSISVFKVGQGYGQILGVLAALDIPHHLVTPSVWKRQMGLTGKDKAASRALAQRMYPTAPLSRVKDHGRAEALLIAAWGQRFHVSVTIEGEAP